MPRQRLTRVEQKAQTRERLLRSAGRVFARQGFQAATLEDVADGAGFTKGAVYASFSSKDELFVALLEDHYDRWLSRLREPLGGDAPDRDPARAAAADFMADLRKDRAWPRLIFEFWSYALRNPEAQSRLTARNEELRDVIAGVFEERAAALGVALSVPVERLSRMCYAMANGVAFDMALEPEAVDSDLFAEMFSIFAAGLVAIADAPAADAAA